MKSMDDLSESRELFEMGFSFYKEEKYKEALTYFDKSIDKNPTYENAWFNKALCHSKFNQHIEAIKAYDKTIELKSDFHDVWYNKGISQYNLELYDNAIESFDKAIDKNSMYVDAYIYKGLASIQLKKYDNAIESFDKAIEIKPNYYYSYYNKGYAYEKSMRFEEALYWYDKTLERVNDDRLTFEGKVFVLKSLGRYDEAALFQKILDNPDQVFKLGRQNSIVLSDIWTVEDKVEYQVYVDTIVKFLLHPDTQFPISMSILSSWGGGKTSIMRSIQKKLDETGYRLSTKDMVFQSTTLKEIKKKINKLVKRKHFHFFKLIKKNDTNNMNDREQVFKIKNVKDENGNDGKVTIWFNVWKYNSVEQLWSGLVDSIVTQISARMDPAEREIFLLQLNLRRLNFDKIRNYIYDTTLNTVLQKIYPWVQTSLIAIVISIIGYFIGLTTDKEIISNSSFAGIIGIVLVNLLKFFKENFNINSKPPEVSLGKYVKIPDYREKSGFIHNTIEDIKIIFKAIPKQYLPMVIFVDDLDRCSPSTIAKVMEGINLFLAGELSECAFIIGMEPEMVVSALEADYDPIIKSLPPYIADSIGWRFVNKFIQLPIVIPPPQKRNIEKYVRNLLMIYDINKNKSTDIFPFKSNGNSNSPFTHQIFNSSTMPIFNSSTMAKTDNDISIELEKQISDEALQIISEFSNNPRGIKRYINLLKYYSLLKNKIKETNKDNLPPDDQIRRFIMLLMKWPSFITWLYWNPGGRMAPEIEISNRNNPTMDRLLKLEKISSQSKKLNDWQNEINDKFNLDPSKNYKNISWINSETLRLFFIKESTRQKEDKLSTYAGSGIY